MALLVGTISEALALHMTWEEAKWLYTFMKTGKAIGMVDATSSIFNDIFELLSDIDQLEENADE